jgi:LPXTG-motif cell wall-anchored protein
MSELAGVTLAPGDILALRGTLTLTSTTTHKDTAIVAATGSTSGVRVSDSDPYTVVPQQPATSIAVAAGASGSDSITVPTQNGAYVQQSVTATAKNTGTEPLTGIAFTDTTNSGDAITGWTWTYGSQANRPISELPDLSLPPGQTVTFAGTLKIVGTSTHKNTVTVSAAGSLSAKLVTGSDPFTAVPLATLTWSGTDGGGHLLAGTEWTITPGGGQAQAVTDNTGQPGYSGLDQDASAGKLQVANLAQGSYTLAQTKAPAGFIAAASRGVTLNKGGTTGVGAVSNQQISAITLPNTGSRQASLLTSLALTALLGALVLARRTRVGH